jgi:CDP-glucose 4,6-dehydratase
MMHLGKLGNMFDRFINTYKGKKVFITGHTGFKGSWLLKILSILGSEIKGYAHAPNTENDLYHLINGDQLCDSVIGELCDPYNLKKAILDFQPDYIFHFAAQPLVRLSYDIPARTFEVNAIGTAYLLDAVREISKPCNIILITTDKVYHNNEWEYPYRENDRLGGFDPYSASKACAELVIDSYRNSFFNTKDFNNHQKGIAVARAGNVIGGGDWSKDRLIPDIARALGNNEDVVIRNPTSVRPWQHVLEPLGGYLLLGVYLNNEAVKFSQAFNFGPYSEDALSVDKMVKLAIDCWGNGKYTVPQLDKQPHEAGLLKLDISKVTAELNWKPKFNASKAVDYTISWYREFFKDKSSINNFTENQIRTFFNG